MIDSNELNTIIATKAAEAVQEQVAKLFETDANLLAGLRSQAVSLLVSNFNIDEVVNTAIATEVATLIADKVVAQAEGVTTIDTLIDIDTINQEAMNSVQAATQDQVAKLFKTNTELLTQLKVHAINKIVSKIVFEEKIEDIVGTKLKERFEEHFNGSIYSDAIQRELTIMDDTVVVENELVSRTAKIVEQAVTKDLTVTGNLVVLGSVDSTHPMAWAAVVSDMKREVTSDVVTNTKDEMVTDVLAKADLIDFGTITMDGQVVLSLNKLGNQITESNLLKVGRLSKLETVGETSLFNDSLSVQNKRVGINTVEPTCALDIWDNEVELIVGKLKEQTGFIGTARSQTLEIGVNSTGHLKIDNTGTVRVEKFQIGERRIAFEGSVPMYAGKPGDFVINTQYDIDARVFGWICKTDFSWVPLRASI